ncbi:MAG: hypothetical protein LLF86_08960 [Nitrospiraceae bacterium]|nr:hypothetical protein [Nitrospiraceae bacterium]
MTRQYVTWAEEAYIRNRIIYVLILLCFLAVLPLYLFGTKKTADTTAADVKQSADVLPVEPSIPAEAANSALQPTVPVSIPSLPDNAPASDPVKRKSPAAEPDNSLELIAKAQEELNRGRFDSSLKLFLEASRKNRSALLGAGISSFMLRDYEKAIEYLESAPDVDGGFMRNKFLSYAYYRVNNIPKSISSAEKGLAVKNDPELRAFLNRLHKETATHKRYIDESASRFKVIFDGYEHGKISRVVLNHLDDAYRKVGSETGYFPEQTVEVILYTGKDFFDVTQAPEWSGGLFDGRIKIPVKGAEHNDTLLRTVLFHEYVHAVIWSITRRCPLWINEGLAEYFSRSHPKKVRQIIPLKNLEHSFSWLSGQFVGLAYVQSWSAVSDMVDKYGHARMMDMLRSYAKNSDIEQAFSSSFGITYSDFISSWGKN